MAKNEINAHARDFLEKLKTLDRKTLAAKVGLSYSYLSGVINGFNPLSDRIRKKIEQGIKEEK
jgi:hypothetical protein